MGNPNQSSSSSGAGVVILVALVVLLIPCLLGALLLFGGIFVWVGTDAVQIQPPAPVMKSAEVLVEPAAAPPPTDSAPTESAPPEATPATTNESKAP